ncbi:MAG: hypothetical protein GXP14_05125 [Gammaproteobacteria bacterium]|nr:hypothetical protein [Gammaproteobacteria bacterium]
MIKPHGSSLSSVFDRECTCGEKAKQCPFWSPVLERIIQQGDQADLTQRYASLIDVASELYGEDVVIVDSSKSIQALQSLKLLRLSRKVNVQILHTIRDVRGWMDSIRRAEKRKKEMSWGKIFEPDFKDFRLSYLRHNILRNVPFWLPHEWLLRNKRLLNHIERSEFPRLDLSYEALVFDTERVMSEIEAFADLKNHESCSELPEREIHIIRGNRTAFTSSPDAPLYYGANWMSKWKWSAMLGILPWISKYNKRNVYYYL